MLTVRTYASRGIDYRIMGNMKKTRSLLINATLIMVAATAILIFLVRWDYIDISVQEKTAGSTEKASAPIKDDIRREHAAIVANRLFTQHLVMKQPVEASQQGLDSLLSSRTEGTLTDPLTRQPYTYAPDQTTMKVGEAAFRVNASCDDKVSGSNGTGLIVDAGSYSVAVALRLESGGFVCESNL